MGVSTGWGGTERLVSVVGEQAARRLLLGSPPLDAGAALRLGLADSVLGSEIEPLAPERLAPSAGIGGSCGGGGSSGGEQSSSTVFAPAAGAAPPGGGAVMPLPELPLFWAGGGDGDGGGGEGGGELGGSSARESGEALLGAAAAAGTEAAAASPRLPSASDPDASAAGAGRQEGVPLAPSGRAASGSAGEDGGGGGGGSSMADALLPAAVRAELDLLLGGPGSHPAPLWGAMRAIEAAARGGRRGTVGGSIREQQESSGDEGEREAFLSLWGGEANLEALREAGRL